jgi:antitoxin (DNA-binding transcriptional repressor) of toxin-antitoxin stability system
MKTISMVELRTHSTRVVRELERGVRMTLSYRGKPLAELVPLANRDVASPLDALALAQQAAAERPDHPKAVAAYLKELARDRIDWSTRS